MVRFFEFNDFGFNISSACIKDMYIYLDALQKDIKWAYRRELFEDKPKKLNPHKLKEEATKSEESEFNRCC